MSSDRDYRRKAFADAVVKAAATHTVWETIPREQWPRDNIPRSRKVGFKVPYADALALYDAVEAASVAPPPAPDPSNGRISKHYRARAIITAVREFRGVPTTQKVEIIAVQEMLRSDAEHLTDQQIRNLSGDMSRSYAQIRRAQTRKAVKKHKARQRG